VVGHRCWKSRGILSSMGAASKTRPRFLAARIRCGCQLRKICLSTAWAGTATYMFMHTNFAVLRPHNPAAICSAAAACWGRPRHSHHRSWLNFMNVFWLFGGTGDKI